MPSKDYNRAERIADLLQRELADLMRRELADERLHGVTVSGVDVSKDLGHAKVFVTPALGADVDATIQGLNRASRHLRRCLARRVHLRYMPQLRFAYDPTLENANRLDALLAASRQRDVWPAPGSEPWLNKTMADKTIVDKTTANETRAGVATTSEAVGQTNSEENTTPVEFELGEPGELTAESEGENTQEMKQTVTASAAGRDQKA